MQKTPSFRDLGRCFKLAELVQVEPNGTGMRKLIASTQKSIGNLKKSIASTTTRFTQ